MRRGRRPIAFVCAVLASLAVLSAAPPAGAEDPPTLRVFAAASQVTVERGRRDWVWIDPGVWIASVGGAFELRASRPDYLSPITLVQTDAVTGEVVRTLPADLLEGWYGLGSFLHVSVKDVDGRVLSRGALPFCPNTWYRSRLDDTGPLNPRYPFFCGGGPFTRGTVWGIDDRWAVGALSDYGVSFRATRRHYTVRVWIDPVYVELLGIAPEDAEVSVHVVAVDGEAPEAAPPPVPSARPSAAVPTVTQPPAEGLPDLVALPAWGFNVYQHRGRDYLAFNATEWNAGPGTLAVEGFRGEDQDAMAAFQYFLVEGEPVGRAPIGELEFHRGGGHDHWHFEEFTRYSLLDASMNEVAPSGKQSWCLANTDAIDLSVPNANWTAWGGDLSTMCGGPGALWVREILDVGWGDTYSQYVAGQAFDITDLPNGRYYVRVHVNPTGSMFEAAFDNNVELRLVKLRGRPGARYVVVPPWNGIDTEGGTCYYPCYY